MLPFGIFPLSRGDFLGVLLPRLSAEISRGDFAGVSDPSARGDWRYFSLRLFEPRGVLFESRGVLWPAEDVGVLDVWCDLIQNQDFGEKT